MAIGLLGTFAQRSWGKIEVIIAKNNRLFLDFYNFILCDKKVTSKNLIKSMFLGEIKYIC